MDLNRQALLVAAVAVLGPAAVWHARHPGQLARTIGRQGVLPGPAPAWAGAVVAFELGVLAASVAAAFSSSARPAGVLLAVAGAAFATYVTLLRRRAYQGDCGCAPVAASVTGLSVVPGAALLAAGLVLAVDPTLDGGLAATSGPLDTTLALIAAALGGALVSLLPASAVVGDPRTLEPGEA